MRKITFNPNSEYFTNSSNLGFSWIARVESSNHQPGEVTQGAGVSFYLSKFFKSSLTSTKWADQADRRGKKPS